MFSSDNNLTEEQARLLNDFLSQFNALQGPIPAQLEGFSNTLNLVETNLNERLNQEISHVMSQAEDAIKNLGAEIQEFMDTHVILKSNLHEEQQRVAALHPVPTPTPVVPNPSTPLREISPMLKVKEPNAFSGKAAYCNAFFSQLILVFASNPYKFESDRAKILYAISYMTGVAFAYMEPYLQDIYSDDPPAILDDFKVFKDTITLAFGDNHPVVNAEASIRSLKQTGPVSVYVTEFRRLSMLLKWNDEALISQFKLNLKEFIVKELARRGTTHKTLDEIMNAAIDIDNLFYSVTKTQGSSHHNHSNNNHHQKQQNNNQYKNHHHKNSRSKYHPPRSNYQSGNMNQHHASSSGNNNAPTPMELGAVNQHKQLTQADKDFRKANGLCLYCGSKDHILRNCNRKKPMINNGIDLAMEGETAIDLAAVTHFTSGKRKLPTDFLDSLDVGEIKKVATSKFESIIVIPITAYHGPNEEEASGTDALIDTGAIHNFVSLEWADYLGIPIEKFDLDQRRTYRLADGTEYVCKAFCAITIRIDDTHHVENTTFHILESCSFHVILGMQWLKRHRPHLSFNDNYQKIIMNCLTTRCTPVNFDIESPVAKLLGATTTTTASSPVVAEATLSFPTTPVVEVLTPLVVANRPPTPHPSILDIEPYWPEPTTCAVPSLPPSLFQMEPFWEEEQSTFIHNPIMVTGWEEAPVNEEGPGSTWLQDATNGNWMEPVWLNEFNEEEQQEEEEVLVEPFIFNNIDFNNDSDDHWATRIRDHYPEDDAASIISVLAGRYQQRVNMEYPPSPPAHHTDGPLLDPVTIAALGSPTIRDEDRIRTINDLFGLNLPLHPETDDNNSSERFSVVIDEDHVVTTYNDYNLFDNNNHSNYSPCLPIFTMLILNDNEAHSPNNKKVVMSVDDDNTRADNKLQTLQTSKRPKPVVVNKIQSLQTIHEYTLTNFDTNTSDEMNSMSKRLIEYSKPISEKESTTINLIEFEAESNNLSDETDESTKKDRRHYPIWQWKYTFAKNSEEERSKKEFCSSSTLFTTRKNEENDFSQSKNVSNQNLRSQSKDSTVTIRNNIKLDMSFFFPVLSYFTIQ